MNTAAPSFAPVIIDPRTTTPAQLGGQLTKAITANQSGGTFWLRDYPGDCFIVGGIVTTELTFPPFTTAPNLDIEEAVREFIFRLPAYALQVAGTIGWWEQGNTIYIDLGQTYKGLLAASFDALTRSEQAVGWWQDDEYKGSIPVNMK